MVNRWDSIFALSSVYNSGICNNVGFRKIKRYVTMTSFFFPPFLLLSSLRISGKFHSKYASGNVADFKTFSTNA